MTLFFYAPFADLPHRIRQRIYRTTCRVLVVWLCIACDSPAANIYIQRGTQVKSRVSLKEVHQLKLGAKPPPDAAPTLIDFSELDMFLHRHQQLFNRTGVLIRKSGRIVYMFGDVQSPVYAASCSKWLSTATFMRLVEKNQMKLDTPAIKYMPQLPPREGALTLRQLLSHTAGLGPAIQKKRDEPSPLRRPKLPHLRFTKEESPGFCYENAGVNWAGKIAEKITDKKWSRLFRDELATPLGLTNAYYQKSNPNAAAGAMISASDYSQFLEMIRRDGLSLYGVRVLSKASVREMLRNHTQGVEMKCVPRPSTRKESHGLGVWRRGSKELPDLASHFGAGGYKVFVDFCRDLTAVFAIEHKPKKQKRAKDVTRQIFDIVSRAIPVTAACTSADNASPNQWLVPLRPPDQISNSPTP